MYESLEQAKEYKEIAVSAISRTDESVSEGRGDPERDPGLDILMRDIKINGLTHPPTVELVSGTGQGAEDLKRYKVVIGNRRFEAVKRIGWPSMKCLIRPGLSSTQKEVITFSENIHRLDYTPYERAKVIQRMVDDWGGDKTALAKALGYTSAGVINDWLAPLALDPEAAETLKKAQLGSTVTAKRSALIAKLPRPLQKQTAEILNEKATSEYEARKIVNAIKKDPTEDPRVVVERFQSLPRTTTMIVSLREPVNTALEKASATLRDTKTKVAERAIEQFLTKEGYLSDRVV